MLFTNKTVKQNSTRLAKICEDLIEKYQSHNSLPSCKDDLMEVINTRIHAAKKEIAEWKDYDTDYIKIAHTMLSHATFDLLVSGKYHLYYGILNPMSCANNLQDVYKASMEYGVKTNIIDETTRKEQEQYLFECIFHVG